MSPQAKLVAMIVAFAAPVVIAAALVFSGWQPATTGNHGELVQPPEPVGQLEYGGAGGWEPKAWQGRWQYLLALPADGCNEACLEWVDTMTRVRTALHRDAERLRIRVIASDEAHLPDALDRVDGVTGVVLDALEHSALLERGGAQSVHIVDPEGYRMMVHRDPVEASDLLSDTRRLLRASDERQERALRDRADAAPGEPGEPDS